MSKDEIMTNNDLIISTTDDQNPWYEVELGEWRTSLDVIDRIEMGIREILWRLKVKSGK